MKRTPLDALVTSSALSAMASGSDVVDFFEDSELEAAVEIKNVCAKVSVGLSDKIDEICAILNIRKRLFLECAFIEAVQKAEAILEAEGFYEHFAPQEAAK